MKGMILVGLCVLLVMISSASAQDSGFIGSSDIAAVLTNQNPNPVEPGEIVNIEIEIQNNGYSDAMSQVIEFVEEDPFSLLLAKDRIKTFNRIPLQGSVKITYKVKVSAEAHTNTYDLNLKMYSENQPSLSTKKAVSVAVQGNPKMTIQAVTLNPEVLEPSGSGELLITLRNAGTGTATQIQAELTPNSTAIVPILSGGLQYIDKLEPADSTVMSFRIGIDENADYKTYDSSLTLTYKDESNVEQTAIFSLGIPVTGTILLDVIKIEPNYERGLLRIEIANKGTTTAKSVEAKLMVDDELIDIDYISQIKPNKQTTFDFPIQLSGKGKLILNYIGPGLEQNSVEKDIVLSFILPTEGNGTTTAIIVVIVLVVLYFLLRKFVFKKKKKR